MDEEAAAGFVYSLVKEVDRVLDSENPPFLVDTSTEPLSSLCTQVIMLFSDKEQAAFHRKIVFRLLLRRDPSTSLDSLAAAFHRAYTHVLSHELRRRIPAGSFDAFQALEEQNATTLVAAHEISQFYEDRFLHLQRLAFSLIDDKLRVICLMIYRARLAVLRSISIVIRDIREIHSRLSSEQNLKSANQAQLLADCFTFNASIRTLRRDLNDLARRLGLPEADINTPADLGLTRTASGDAKQGSSFVLDKVLSVSLRDPTARHLVAVLPVELVVASLSRRELFGRLRRNGVYGELLRGLTLPQCLKAFAAAGQRDKFWQVLFRACVEYLSAIGLLEENSNYLHLYSDVVRLYLFLFDLYGLKLSLTSPSEGIEERAQASEAQMSELLTSVRTPFALALGRTSGRIPDILPGNVPALEVFRSFCQHVHSISEIFDYMDNTILATEESPSEQKHSPSLWNAVFADLRVATRDFVRKLVKEECYKQAAFLDSPPQFGLFKNSSAYELSFVTEDTLVLHFQSSDINSTKIRLCSSLFAEVERRGTLRGCLQALDVVVREENVEQHVSLTDLLDYAAKYCADSQNASIDVDEGGTLSTRVGLYPRVKRITYSALFGDFSIQLTSLASISFLQALVTLSTLSRCVPRRDLAEGVIYTRQTIVYYIAKVLGLYIKPVPRKASDPLTTLFDFFVEAAEAEREKVQKNRVQTGCQESSRTPVPGSPQSQTTTPSRFPSSRLPKKPLPKGVGVREALYTMVELFPPGIPSSLLALAGVYSLMRQTQTLQPILVQELGSRSEDEYSESRSAVVAALSCKLRILREICGVCATRWFDLGPAFSLAFDAVIKKYETAEEGAGTTEFPDLALTIVNRILGTICSIRLYDNITGADILCSPLGEDAAVGTVCSEDGTGKEGSTAPGSEPFYGQLQVAFWKALYEEVCHQYIRELARVRRKGVEGGMLAMADFSVFKRGMAKLLPLRPEDSVSDSTSLVTHFLQRSFFPQE